MDTTRSDKQKSEDANETYNTIKIAMAALGVGTAVGYAIYKLMSSQPQEKPVSKKTHMKLSISIYYCSENGTSEKVAHLLETKLADLKIPTKLRNMSAQGKSDVDPEDLNKDSAAIFVIPTYDGKMPAGARFFEQWLEEAAVDHRVPDGYLQNLRYFVVGLGDLNYGQALYCKAAKWLHRLLQNKKFMAHPLKGVTEIDAPSANLNLAVARFMKTAKAKLKQASKHKNYGKMKGGDRPDPHQPGGLDLEDLDMVAEALNGDQAAEAPRQDTNETKEMLNDKTRKALKKVGYKLVGSHSGVKICRWTKASLRGRGGCYKHTFYNITSHRCMEMTPSMACANKCVFCWRQHLNPVATEWKWLMDDPDFILEGAIKEHCKALKCVTPAGCPGVTEERYQEAMKPAHVALSLVGEPIMYPKINELCKKMHERKMSTFMVTNAQFPEALRSLVPVTQLYLSIDAATRDSLRRIDRPLNKDFWERFLECIDILRTKKQRTVFRMTMVKGYNVEEIADYARLVARGQPSFIEIKAVTYTGHDQPIEFVNIPFLIELQNYAEKLCSYISDDYELACIHKHSLCALLAHKRFKTADGGWKTWIDYPSFYALEAGDNKDFTDLDYALETPSWALWGSEEGGFDPEHKRHFRRMRRPEKRNQALEKAEAEVEKDRATWVNEDAGGKRTLYLEEKQDYPKEPHAQAAT